MAVKNYSFDFLTDEALSVLNKGYLQEGETPYDMYSRMSRKAALYLKDLGLDHLEVDPYDVFMEMFSNGWFSPSTPVACNFGGNSKDLPVSCFCVKVGNSVNNIYEKAHEVAMLSKYGGGVGVDISDLIGPAPITNWARLYDFTSEIISRGGVRRGAIAIYLDADHPEILDFLNSKELLKGDPRLKISSNIGIKFSDDFMVRLISGGKKEFQIFTSVINLRMKYGSPYLFFSDNVSKGDPLGYQRKGLKTTQSNLCSEITLYTSPNDTAICVLSSFNLNKWDEYKDKFYGFYHVLEFGIYFLDAVCQDFIDRSEGLPGFDASRKTAIEGRALGLGVLGLHSYFQQKGLAFGDEEAKDLEAEIFGKIKMYSDAASHYLIYRGYEAPELCKVARRRNTHLIAIAPTTTNSVLCDGGSPGIEPLASNYFSAKMDKGVFIRKNKNLEKLLDEKGKNTEEVWKSISINGGSVKHLSFLSPREKEIFKTFKEIDQREIIEHAAIRQKFIDQAQSLNLFLAPDMDQQEIVDLHLLSWKLGLKTLYYVRSESLLNGIKNKRVKILTRDNCVFCMELKSKLKEHSISFVEEYKEKGSVPEIHYSGVKLEGGTSELFDVLGLDTDNGSGQCSDGFCSIPNAVKKKPFFPEVTCSSCDG